MFKFPALLSPSPRPSPSAGGLSPASSLTASTPSLSVHMAANGTPTSGTTATATTAVAAGPATATTVAAGPAAGSARRRIRFPPPSVSSVDVEGSSSQLSSGFNEMGLTRADRLCRDRKEWGGGDGGKGTRRRRSRSIFEVEESTRPWVHEI